MDYDTIMKEFDRLFPGTIGSVEEFKMFVERVRSVSYDRGRAETEAGEGW